MMQGPGAFIDPRTTPELFNYIFDSTKNISNDISLIYLFFVVVFTLKKQRNEIYFRKPFLFYSIYILFLIVFSLVLYGTAYESFNVIRLLTNMLIGFFLIAYVFSQANEENFVQFLNVGLIFTAIGSILYVLNSSHTITVFYEELTYTQFDFGSKIVNRDFRTFPIMGIFFFTFALSALLFRDKRYKSYVIYCVIIAFPFALLYSFTRSLLMESIFQILIVIMLLAYKNPKRIINLSLIILSTCVLLFAGVIETIFSDELDLFSSRIVSAKEEGKEEGSVNIRIEYIDKVVEILNKDNTFLFGSGINKQHWYQLNSVGGWMADSTIPFFLLYTGIIGTVIYFLIYLFFSAKALVYYLKKPSPVLVTIFSFLLVSTLASIIMSGQPWGSPLYFMYINFLIAYIGFYHQNRSTSI